MNSPLYTLHSTFSRYYDYKEVFSDMCNNYIVQIHPHGSDVFSLCQGADVILRDLISITSNELNNIGKRCIYLSYILYDKIKEIAPSIDNIDNLYNTLDVIMLHYSLNISNCIIEKF